MKLTLPVSRVSFCLVFSFVSLITTRQAFSQSLGINSTGAEADPSAALDVNATNKGLLIPRVALTAANSASPIAAPAASLLVYNTATAGTAPNQVEPGYYYWNGSQWVRLANANASSATTWNLNGNAGTDPATNFIGTTDSKPLIFKVNGEKAGEIPHNDNSSLFLGYQAGAANAYSAWNTALGNQALFSNTNGSSNTASGSQAMFSNISGSANTAHGNNALRHNKTGSNNTAVGWGALFNNSEGGNNTAVGSSALRYNSTAWRNTALGVEALYSNTTGSDNVALGNAALFSNQVGGGNTAVGVRSLASNTEGIYNTAIGNEALSSSTTSKGNTAIGHQTLLDNYFGSYNTAIGKGSLSRNRAGYSNVAIGISALHLNINKSNLVAIGDSALYNNGYDAAEPWYSVQNTAVGSKALYSNTIGAGNTAMGFGALYSNKGGNQNIAIGYNNLTNNTTGSGNTGIGTHTLLNNVGGDFNTGVGVFAGPTDNYLMNTGAFGYQAASTASNHYRIGNSAVTNIGGQVNWSAYSDQRFKVDVQENVKGLDFILKLRPVTYHWDIDSLNRFIYGKAAADTLFAHASAKEGIDHQEKITYTGFLAQEVEAAAQSIDYDFSGVSAPANERTPYSIRYAEFVVPLVKAVQEQQGQLGQQNQVLAGLSSRMDRPVVKLASAKEWADRVFEPGYRLRPLSEVERYMTQHKHLPGIPSAKELAEKGVDVSAMLSKHMEKIEELTLYVVELEKRNNELARKNEKLEQLEAIVKELQKEIKAQRGVK